MIPSSQNDAVAFTTTHWSMVLQAQDRTLAAETALESLCRTYWRPIYTFVRREGVKPEEAKDITQGFFALILERKDFQSVRQEKGRLRSFLLASLKHFMMNERRDAAAIKRGGGQALIPLDDVELYDSSEFDRSDMLSADLLYDRRWAFTVLDRVFARLREESQGSANAPLLERLNELLSDEPDRPSQAEIAREFGMTENAVKQAFHRLRQRYRQLLREEVAHTVQRRPRLKMNCATSSPRCARNLWRIFVHYLSERNGGAMRITIAKKFCRKCGAAIPPNSPQQSCGACLLETGLGADGAVAGVDDPGRSIPILMDFGDYELLEQIGRGGQGVVFRARQKSLNRIVALKVIGLGHWATEAHLKRFRLEAKAAARLEHPGIVPIYEVGERDGSCYFSMKFVEGGQLDEVTKRDPLPPRRAAELIAKIARIVHYAHEHGILHRDNKPGNILLDQKSEPHLTDFGLARLVESESTVTRTMEVLGTPSYMAPEQAVGNNAAISSVTDVYGLCAVLYQLLTGQPPFAGGTTYETIKLLLDTEPRQPRLLNPKIDRDLSTICLKCLEKDPKRRYSSAVALAEDLERWLKHEPIVARQSGIFTRGRKWVQRNPTSALLVASLVALVAAAGWIVWKSEFIRHPLTTGIAVLPFENLSDEKEHAFFADGVQDDILTKLAKIADLKVISRTSVMGYRGKRNMREIGNELRVSHVLEGSVRRVGAQLHVNAQLVDTRTDAGIWAEEYDRDLNDVFAIETEVAQSIANRLRAKVSAREKVAMQEWPTKDLVGYDLYVRSRYLIEGANIGNLASYEKDLFQAVELINQAIASDPAF